MDYPQMTIAAILVAAVVLFIWGRPCYDVVAALALLATAIAGLVPAGSVFAGFGHPAVITVVAVLITPSWGAAATMASVILTFMEASMNAEAVVSASARGPGSAAT